MKLSVNKAITGALGFSLRHAVPFYLLGLAVGLPSYLHSFLPPEGRPGNPRYWWETELAIPAIEAMLFGALVAIMVHSLKRDRRGERRPVWPSLFEAAPRLPTVIAVSVIIDVSASLLAVATECLDGGAAILAMPIFILVVFLYVAFCVAVPCAAVDNAGVVYCFERSVKLTSGSRWRIVAIFALSSLLPIAAIVAAVLASYGAAGFTPLLIWLASAAGFVYLAALGVVLHEALVIIREGAAADTLATAFD